MTIPRLDSLLVFTLAALALGVAGCGGGVAYNTHGTARAPGADATIQVNPMAGGSSEIHVHVSHMPPPERLARGATTYAVWARPAGQDAVRIGNLPMDGRDAYVRGTTVARSFEVLITAERTASARVPSEHIALQQRASL